MELTFNDLLNYASQWSYSKPYYQKLEDGLSSLLESGVIKDVIESSQFFYPKYLWKEDIDIELFFFTEEKIISCTFSEEGTFNVRTRYIKNILSMELSSVNINKREAMLTITFANGEIFTFSSNDSNDAWENKFYHAVLEIHNLLS